MNLQFFDSYPYRPLSTDLEPLVVGAQRIDAAIAFVTCPGAALIRKYLKTQPPRRARLVASVRFPTNLLELASLEEDFSGTVFIHTGFEFPKEEDGDRGQFHSKVVLIEHDRTERTITGLGRRPTSPRRPSIAGRRRTRGTPRASGTWGGCRRRLENSRSL